MLSWEGREEQNKLILELCREAGDRGTDRELIDGFRGNHNPSLIKKAAEGDVQALMQLRNDVGLPIL